MGYVKRRGTTSKSKNLVENFKELKASFLEQVSTTVIMDEIPPELGSNWSQFDSIILLDHGAARSQAC